MPQIGGGYFAYGVACGTEGLAGDAALLTTGHLVAFSSSRSFGTCLDDSGIDGPPTEVQVARYDAGKLTFASAIPGTGIVRTIRLLPRSDGAWLIVFRGDANVATSLQAVRLDAGGAVVGAAIDLPAFTTIDDGVAAAPMKDGFAVAYIDESGQVPHLMVSVYGETGLSLASGGVGAGLARRPALLSSPAADALVIAWEEGASPMFAHRVKVARLGCGPPPM